ncbi:MAG TPA: hypothetical protein VK672_01975 [Solirubrobacteraceae bacterium]|jgi:hypothetical protein|nr:hypothetical protein [Solirubrobacteraceae bacterium]
MARTAETSGFATPGWQSKAGGVVSHLLDIHAEVEELLGKSVPASSVKNWLAKQVQDQKPQVVRLGRGRYRLVVRNARWLSANRFIQADER